MVGDDGAVKVLDFGLARAADDGAQVSRPTCRAHVTQGDSHLAPLTRTGVVLGTPAYMSPEAPWRRAVDGGQRSVQLLRRLYQCLYEQPPFDATSMATLLADRAARQGRAAAREHAGAGAAVPARSAAAWRARAGGALPRRWRRCSPSSSTTRATAGRRVAALGLTAVVTADCGVLIAAAREPAVQPCPDAQAELAGVWNATRAAAVRDALKAIGTPAAADALAGVLPRIGPLRGVLGRDAQRGLRGPRRGAPVVAAVRPAHRLPRSAPRRARRAWWPRSRRSTGPAASAASCRPPPPCRRSTRCADARGADRRHPAARGPAPAPAPSRPTARPLARPGRRGRRAVRARRGPGRGCPEGQLGAGLRAAARGGAAAPRTAPGDEAGATPRRGTWRGPRCWRRWGAPRGGGAQSSSKLAYLRAIPLSRLPQDSAGYRIAPVRGWSRRWSPHPAVAEAAAVAAARTRCAAMSCGRLSLQLVGFRGELRRAGARKL